MNNVSKRWRIVATCGGPWNGTPGSPGFNPANPGIMKYRPGLNSLMMCMFLLCPFICIWDCRHDVYVFIVSFHLYLRLQTWCVCFYCVLSLLCSSGIRRCDDFLWLINSLEWVNFFSSLCLLYIAIIALTDVFPHRRLYSLTVVIHLKHVITKITALVLL